MRIFGWQMPFGRERKANPPSLQPPPVSRGGWYPLIREPFTGAWQRNMSVEVDTSSSFHADFACKTLIARDIAKMRVKLVEKDDDNIWTETTSPAFSPVLRQPNAYQSRNQFWESWLLSKLSRGNAYVLKVRDNRNVITELHVLDPIRVQPLIADDGSIYYRLSTNYLAGVGDITVPAREIIHDRFNCLFHPLVGTPPVFASGLAALLGLNAQKAAALLFENNSTPGGILTAPGNISETEEKRIKEQWEQLFSALNLGRIAVMSGGMTYQKMPLTAVETQMIDQLKWSAETVCSVYHVPAYKVGIDVLPRGFTNLQALNVEYYSQALQSHIEEIEELLDYALGIAGTPLGTEFDTDALLRMDSLTQVTFIRDAVAAGVMAPNEGRGKLDLKPVDGGESPYLQQQNYSLAALAKRDAQADPFASKAPAAPAAAGNPPEPAPPPPAKELDDATIAQLFAWELKSAHRELREAA